VNLFKTFFMKYSSHCKIQHTPYYLIALLVFNMLLVAIVSIGLLYQIGFKQQKDRLVELVETQGNMIEIVANQELKYQEKSFSGKSKNQIAEEVIRKVTKANYHYAGFGKTGEFTLGRHEEDKIQYIIKQRHYDIEKPIPILWDSKLGEPMRRALKGQAGIDVLLDYRGTTVLAAYKPIKNLGWGLVAKIDLDEVREPYIAAGSYALIATLILAIGGSIIFWFFVNSLVKNIEGSRQFNRLLISKSPVGLALCTLDGYFVDVNVAFSKIIGRDMEEILSLNYFDCIAGDYIENEMKQFELLKAKESISPYESHYIHKSGERIPVKISGEIIKMKKAVYVWLSVDNIKEYKRREAKLLLSNAVFDNTTEVIFITDKNHKIIKVNKAFTAVTGYKPEEVFGRNPEILRSGKHNKNFYNEIFKTVHSKGKWRGEIWNKKKDATLFPSLQSISAIHDENGELIRYVSILTDISTQKAYEQQLLDHSHHDFLTGLPNRFYFEQTLDQALLRAKHTHKKFTLFFIDLNRFKEINDTLGHDAGDILLKTMAERLRDSLRSDDFVARLGGDEFVIILESINERDSAIKVAENILTKTKQTVRINENEIIPYLSIGIAFYPDHGTDALSLLKSADESMYYAKHHVKEHYYIHA
jgi:diguanylate cyclase (GGDEF)-like protein/PAS domain S-box-containing protein